MCRWMVYKGQEVLLAELVTRPPNSIIHQSRHSPYLPYLQGSVEEIKARNHAINGDGFGVAWYDHVCPDEPCVFTSVQPSWHCTNLQNLANHIRTHCIFAHVRAASPGSLISQSNCHPFRFGRLLFMHNGGIAHFEQIKYSILHTIQHTSASYVRGTTDSETAGALFVHYLGDPTAVHDGHALKAAMLKMMSHLVGLIRWQESKVHHQQQQQQTTSGSSPRGPPHAVGSPRPCGLAATADGHMPSSLNFAVTDGCVVIATRYRDSKEQDPPSLYYSEAQQMIDPQDGSASPLCWKYPSKRLIDSIVISSEPLTKDESAWKLVPRNHLLVVTNSQRTVIEPINLRTLHSSSDSVDIFEPDASASELAAAGKWDESQQVATRIDASSSPSPSSSSSSSSGHARRHSTAPGGGGGGGRRAAAVAAAAKRRVASSVHLAVPAGRQQEPHLPLHKRSASHESGLSSSSSSSFPAHSQSTTTTRASSSSSSAAAAAAATDSPTTTTTTTAAAMSKSQKKKMKKKKMKQQQQAKEVEASNDEEEEEDDDDDDDKEHEEEQKEEKEEATDASKQEEEEEEEGAVLPSITINDNGSSQQKDKKKKKKKKKRLQFLPKYILPTPATSAATPTQQQQQQQKHPQEEQQQQQQPPEMTLRSLLAFWRGFAAGLGLALLLFLLAFVAVVVAGHYQFPLSPADHLQLHQHHHHQYGGEGSIQ